jgi:hypothetical protein
MVAAIEIYNKPRFEYRDECFVILLLNAWELLLKALLSKNRTSIYYPKKRNQPYRTLSCTDAFKKAEKLLPKALDPVAIGKNLDLLGTYRDNTVHFYNDAGFGTVIYGLAQTSIVNFKDVLQEAFAFDLGEEITWQLLPLGLRPPIDPIDYISKGGTGKGKSSEAVVQFLAELARSTEEVRKAGADTGRLLTVFSVKLESTKKISDADITVGVEKATEGPLAIVKKQDPKITHPLRQKDILAEVITVSGVAFSSHVFNALVWKHKVKENPQFAWYFKQTNLTLYSRELVTWIKALSKADIEAALTDYRAFLAKSRGAKKSA